VFVDVTVAYDTLWHRDLTCKLLRMLRDRHMVRMIMVMISNAASPLQVETANGTGYDASKTAYQIDPSWPPFSSTSAVHL